MARSVKHSVNRPPTPDEDVRDSPERDELTLGEIINIKLVESGEKENLMELVRDRLVESGWKDEMRIACSPGIRGDEENLTYLWLSPRVKNGIWFLRIKNKLVERVGFSGEHVKKKGRKDVTVDELIRVITPKGRASVPDAVKEELLDRIHNFIRSAAL
ncbi:hypothetical protein YC2023_105051 [Brassica napus]